MMGFLACGGLFLTALGAGSVLPMQSEAALAGLIALGSLPVWLLVVVATAGNVAGSVVNWFFGRGIERFRDRKWFPANSRMLEKAQRSYHRFGRWSLLLSWVPIIGDPLTIIAGVLREPLSSFIILVTIAKFARYVVVAALATQFL